MGILIDELKAGKVELPSMVDDERVIFDVEVDGSRYGTALSVKSCGKDNFRINHFPLSDSIEIDGIKFSGGRMGVFSKSRVTIRVYNTDRQEVDQATFLATRVLKTVEDFMGLPVEIIDIFDLCVIDNTVDKT